MAKAIWNGIVIAESDDTHIVEGNHYFPPHAINDQHFEASETETVCGWKGTASYYTIVVDGEKNVDAAWFYAEPKPDAAHIAGHVAFWKGVDVQP